MRCCVTDAPAQHRMVVAQHHVDQSRPPGKRVPPPWRSAFIARDIRASAAIVQRNGDDDRGSSPGLTADIQPAPNGARTLAQTAQTEGFGLVARAFGQAHAVVRHLDRKSTRLNSSHSQISYAVFCLKKKK